jgi:hypothetical protein
LSLLDVAAGLEAPPRLQGLRGVLGLEMRLNTEAAEGGNTTTMPARSGPPLTSFSYFMLSSAIALMLSALLPLGFAQSVQPQLTSQETPLCRHSQYFLTHLLFLHLHPRWYCLCSSGPD